MALGVPVIASDIAVFREISAMGCGVSLVPCENPDRLADALLSRCEPSTLRAGELDIPAMQAAYIRLYEKLIESKS